MDKEICGFTLTVPQLRQRDVEEFQRIVHELNPDGGFVIKRNGDIVRAAAQMGWITDVKAEGVDDMPPYAVQALASDISDTYAAAFEVPGE